MYVAVICNDLNNRDLTKRTALTGADKDALVARAFTERRLWEARGNGPYRIFIGKLTAEIVPPSEYREVEL